MITTLVMKFLFWAWNYMPNHDVSVAMIFLAYLETVVEIIAFFVWRGINHK